MINFSHSRVTYWTVCPTPILNHIDKLRILLLLEFAQGILSGILVGEWEEMIVHSSAAFNMFENMYWEPQG